MLHGFNFDNREIVIEHEAVLVYQLMNREHDAD